MRPGDILLPVRVQARSKRDAILGVISGRLRIATTAAPVDGKANRSVTKQLAREFGVAPSCVELIRGETRRDKLFRISGTDRRPEFLSQLRDNGTV